MKIMIVDDNAEMREVIKQLLGSDNIQYLQCEDGMDALESYPTFLPDWVFMDIRMKKTQGMQVTEELRRRDPSARIVIVTQYDDEQYRSEAQRVGAMGFVSKDHLQALRAIVLDDVEQYTHQNPLKKGE